MSKMLVNETLNMKLRCTYQRFFVSCFNFSFRFSLVD